MMATVYVTIFLLAVTSLAAAKPIMVTFGTHQGPIEPPTPSPIHFQPKSNEIRAPAPIFEETDDIPNPEIYKVPVPHQYRNKIYLNRPQSNLILGTPIDQKFTPGLGRDLAKFGPNEGVQYTGPNLFELQDYEILEAKKLSPVSYVKPHYYQEKLDKIDNFKRVPQIGIVYSSGIRYYVPQLAYFNDRQDEEEENSVYDKDDKYLYRLKRQ